ATTTVLVQVIGGGNVQGGNQIDCGGGATACYASFVGTGSVDLTARNIGGWTIDSWSGCDNISSDEQTCSIDLDGTEKEITATFLTVTNPGDSMLTVNNTSDSGTTGGNVGGAGFDCDTGDPPSSGSCSQTYFLGSTITLLEDPADGYEFRGWGGPCSGTATTCTVQLNAPSVTVGASFGKAASSYTLSVAVTGNGTVTGAGGAISCTSAGGSGCTATVAAGSTVTLNATPGAGAGFGGWGGACTVTTTSCTFTITGDTSVSATFTGAGGGGGGGGGGSVTYPLTVSISGTGRVTGAGIDCGDGRTTCSVNLASGTTATLTAAATGGAAFTGWGGACSGTTTTCSVTMTAARSVAATFGSGGGGGGSAGVELTLRVQGKGTVSATGGTCASGGAPTTCRQSYDAGSDVTLTATPQPGASFTGWSGACSGTARTCRITLDDAATVTATFTGARTPTAAGAAVRSGGRPIVARTGSGFRVTLRFTTTQRGTAHVRALRAGRVQTALAFTVAPGAARVGPFPLRKPGFYGFELSLAGRSLRWTACLGRCGAAAHARSFSLTRGPARVLDAGALWSVSVHFHATLPSGALIRIYRSGRLVRSTRRPLAAGDVSAGPFLLSPGTYRLRLTATDAYGRTRALGWYAFLS